MPSGKGFALKLLQWFIRGIQFGCAALVLAIYSYFLATLNNHNLHIATRIRAVAGISGVATLYTIIGLLLLCCLAGHPITSFIAIVLDICFAAAFIYVAVANRGGAGSCDGYVDTPYGQGRSSSDVDGNSGFTNLPSFRQACQMQTACLAVSIVAIFFFLLSAVVEFFLVRHHRKEKRFGPSPQNDYTSGSGRATGGGLFGWRRRKQTQPVDVDNQLPEHTHPDDVRNSYNTEATAVNQQDTGAAYNKYRESGYGYGQQTGTTQPAPQTNPYRYEDGVYDRGTNPNF